MTHYFNQQWHSGEGIVLQSENPANNNIIWSGNSATEQQINQALTAARKGQLHWQMMSIEQRIEILRNYQQLLRDNADELALTISQETGKPLWEAKTEAASMIGKIDLSINAYYQRTGENQIENNEFTAAIRHRAHGVLAVFGPYNFPGHLPNGHIVPALLAGNAIVFKPSELTPWVAEKIINLLTQCNFPSGVITLLQGSVDTAKTIASHPQIDGLLFTGSSKTGKLLHRQFAGNTGKLLALEMGGNNPLIVHAVDNFRAAIYNIIQSAFITAGQRCTCARRLIVINGNQSQQLLKQLADVTNNIEVGSDDNSFMGSVINNRAAESLLFVQQQLLQQGATAITTMRRLNADKPFLTPGIIDVTNIVERVDEEYFGPLLQVIRVNNMEEAIAEANNTRYGLAAGMLTDDDASWQQFFQRSRAGIVNRNRPLTGASGSAPFGGIGDSGNHRPSGWYAADYCAYPVASLEQKRLILPEKLTAGIHI